MGCNISIKPPQKYISPSELHTLLDTNHHKNTVHSLLGTINNYIIIDLRDEFMDYDGGHIDGSIPISHKIFHNKIHEIVTKYNTKTKIIFCDMYGAKLGRSVSCSEHYYNYKREIVSNYSRKEAKSYYYDNKYDVNQNTKRRVEIYCDSDTISNLQKQEIYVLEGGVFELINSSFASIIHNFDESKWEQLELSAVYGEKKWYHNYEYFAENKFTEFKKMRKSTRSLSYNLSSSDTI